MSWVCKFEDRALKDLRKLDRQVQQRIIRFLEERVAPSENPRSLGKPLTGRFTGLWRYRVGDYRVICTLRDAELLVLVVEVGHRREIYDH